MFSPLDAAEQTLSGGTRQQVLSSCRSEHVGARPHETVINSAEQMATDGAEILNDAARRCKPVQMGADFHGAHRNC